MTENKLTDITQDDLLTCAQLIDSTIGVIHYLQKFSNLEKAEETATNLQKISNEIKGAIVNKVMKKKRES